MAEPRIQYAKTSDGVSIAFRVLGEGPPLVLLPNITGSHLQAYLEMPGYRPFLTRLAERLRVVTYDCRGMGMSQRDAIDFSTDAAERDLEAVVDRLGMEKFALYGHLLAGEVAFSYASGQPERVTGLVYWVGQTVAISDETTRRLAIIDKLADEEWDMQVAAPNLDLNAMRAILWSDLEDHSAMMERLGDEKGRDILREHERITRAALAAHAGTEVKAMGDGFMAWFPSAKQALDCAIALEQSFRTYNAAGELQLSVRVGVNAGEPIAEEDDLFGASVIAAARICRQAAGGDIFVSDVVRQLVAGKGFIFAERGEVTLKGFEEPVRLYEVRWREEP